MAYAGVAVIFPAHNLLFWSTFSSLFEFTHSTARWARLFGKQP